MVTLLTRLGAHVMKPVRRAKPNKRQLRDLRIRSERPIHFHRDGQATTGDNSDQQRAPHAVLFLSSDESSFVTGLELPVDSGTLAVVRPV